MEILKGTVKTIFEDFDTGEPVIKENAFAFLLETDKKESIIIVYDKNALKMGLVENGEPLTCFGFYNGDIITKDSTGINSGKRFLCNGIIANVNKDDLMEQIDKMGSITLDEFESRIIRN